MFYPLRSDTGAVLPFEQQPAAAGTYKPGTMLVFGDGKLVVANNPAGRPAYVSVGHETVADGGCLTVACARVDVVFRCDEIVGNVAVGDKVGIVDGVKVSSDAANKIMLVVAVRDDGSVEVR